MAITKKRTARYRKIDFMREATKIMLRSGDDFVECSVSNALARHWSHAVLNRRRWAGDPKAAQRQSDEAASALADHSQAWIGQLSGDQDRLIEVEIPSTELGTLVTVFPWEYVIAATRKPRPKVTVTRTLQLPRTGAFQHSTTGTTLYVESAPGGLRDRYEFASELELVRSALGVTKGEVEAWRPGAAGRRKRKAQLVVLVDPDRATLEAAVRELQPEIIHVTGFDTHQGTALLQELKGSASSAIASSLRDGYLIHEDMRPVPLHAEDLAAALCSARTKPRLIGFNLFNSGARIAALAVKAGAQAALGFLNDFNDSMTERLFADLYSAWRHRPRDPIAAFRWAFDELRKVPNALRGTSVVFYTGEPSSVRPKARKAAADGLSALRESLDKARRTKVAVTDDLGDLIRLNIEPCAAVNYSLLHNARPLFKTFDLVKHTDGMLPDVAVEVTLHLGPDSAPFRRRLHLVDRVTPLAHDVRVPLTSPLARAVRESVSTSLYVRVGVEERTLFESTFPVSLLSANEWRDTDEDRIWLPSFVLPRDPAVARIVDSAQRYLMAIADDPTMGFDGYQSIDVKAEQPYARVDAQVKALWSAILYDHPLSYINPPPTYTESSQRIRTPSEIVDGRRGTCIDLALLFAACLEYVEIYPAIFLLEGHCFPAYWRSDADHEAFELAKTAVSADAQSEDDMLAADAEGRRRARDSYGWYFDKSYFKEIKSWVEKGALVPLESVWLTTRESFASAQDAGEENLRTKREFHSMLDIMRARGAQVTPLPIRGETT